MNYRKIWEQHYGSIPKDEYGRTYEIHHIDGDRSNNNIENLMCVSIEEHYKIHLKQKDYAACHAIKLRMRYTPQEISHLASMAAKGRPCAFNLEHVRKRNLESLRRRIENGTFHLLSGEIQRRTNAKLVAEGKHIFQQQHLIEALKERNTKDIQDGTHPFVGGEMQKRTQRKLVEMGIHHLQTNEHRERMRKLKNEQAAQGKHPFQKVHVCEYCGETGRGAGFHINHNDNCLSNPNHKRIECEHCGKLCAPSIYKRYHGEKCKQGSTTSRKA